MFDWLARLLRRKISGDYPLIADNESPVRRVISEASGREYRALDSLSEAQSTPGGTVILEGDYGGQIYVVSPGTLVNCSESTLRQLVDDLDAIAWPPDGDSAGEGIYFEITEVGSVVPGGMGGGLATGDIWVHPEFASKGLEPAIRSVLAGVRARIKE